MQSREALFFQGETYSLDQGHLTVYLITRKSPPFLLVGSSKNIVIVVKNMHYNNVEDMDWDRITDIYH